MNEEEIQRHDDNQAATRASFTEVPKTCQDVADILGILQEKYGISESDIEFTRKLIARLATSRLRNAHIQALAQLHRAERERDALKLGK